MQIDTRLSGSTGRATKVPILTCLFAACASGQPAELPPMRISSLQDFMGVSFPLEAGPYSAMNVQRYLDPKQGIRIGYVAIETGDQVDIYVYPAPGVPREAEQMLDADSLVTIEFERARADLRTWAFERRKATGVRSAADSAIDLAIAADTIRGEWADFEVSRDHQSYMTSLLLFLKDDTFVKARHSAAPDKFVASSERVLDLIREFLRVVQR